MTRTKERTLCRFVATHAHLDNTLDWEDVERALAITAPNRQIAFRVVAMREIDGVQFWFHCTVSDGGAVESTTKHDSFRNANGDTDTLTKSEIAEVCNAIKGRTLTLHEIKECVQFDWSVGTPPHFSSQVHIPKSEHFFYFVVITTAKED